MTEIQLDIREAQGADAAGVLAASQQLALETDFLLMDDNGLALPEALLAQELEALAEADNYMLLLALDGDRVIGLASIKGHNEYQLAHVGEVGISILKEYWGLGLGTILLEELLVWVSACGVLTRIELTVQARNQRAIGLYQKFAFDTEGCMKQAVQTKEGDKVDVLMMARLFD
ncbi:GNAT family N-acetyltransferase [Enterococcus sp. RIT-PI-f]|uniref:GNAT family N-acetyltransferase n=1 Tax=Enterococcus sp. RIT-PI-f TaxID=1690244 RepID=UPI0006B8D476|nr:GNAT family N-acetyltransferase [Enterococcus sp. RIT-PI-f]KPG73800.1 GNAT family acetyltransferase [Enterococcus sp. RIT-PI-f]